MKGEDMNVKIWKEIESIRKDMVEVWTKLQELTKTVKEICEVWGRK